MSAATPKSLRAALPRRFENYVLTRTTSVDSGLCNVPDSAFQTCVFTAPQDQSLADNVESTPVEIGFNFQLDGINYRSVSISSDGYVCLIDPATGTIAVTTEVLSTSYRNGTIRDTFTSDAVLIAPWFDDLRALARSANHLYQQSIYSKTKADRVTQGLEPPSPNTNQSFHGVRYCRDNKSSKGNRFIVRWRVFAKEVAGASHAGPSLAFDLVLYENGTIEFRYEPIAGTVPSNAASIQDATVGIFMPNGTNRYRDFSYELGYRTNDRARYQFGGAVYDGVFSETDPDTALAVDYACKLTTTEHWPAISGVPSKFTFSPPVAKRKILPKKQVRIGDSESRTKNSLTSGRSVSFDDRLSVNFVGAGSGSTVVSYPTTLTRFFADTNPLTAQIQDIFNGDIQVTASTNMFAAEQFLSYVDERPTAPFTEHKIFENDAAAANQDFFLTGSNLDKIGVLSNGLRSKTQIKLTLPINHNVKMPTSSSLMYYNNVSKSWCLPQNSSYVISNTATTNDSGRQTGPLYDVSANANTPRRIIEEVQGFGPLGNFVASGSTNNPGTGEAWQSDSLIKSHFTRQNTSEALAKEFTKSITFDSNERYRAQQSEIIKLPLKGPFVIEKAVIELPVAAGDDWFRSRTQSYLTSEIDYAQPGGSIEFMGPALTVALFNQITEGSRTRRELILSGTITHTFDNTQAVTLLDLWNDGTTYHLMNNGFAALGGAASAVITPENRSGILAYTGSVKLNTEAQSSNGMILALELMMTGAGSVAPATTIQNRMGIQNIMSSSTLLMKNANSADAEAVAYGYQQTLYIASINPFGRASRGFDAQGRSVFGKEYITSDKLGRKTIPNPFYFSGAIPTDIMSAINAGTQFTSVLMIPALEYAPSPYLVNPGDSLVLAVSKNRPNFAGSSDAFDQIWTSGSLQQDFQLITGSVNITLYGSYLQEGKEYYETVGTSLDSDAMHEVIGNDPVLDQFEVSHRNEYISGTFDDYVAGSMISRVYNNYQTLAFVTGTLFGSPFAVSPVSTGSRGKIFSRAKPNEAPTTPGASEFDYTPSVSYRSQPFSEKAGIVRNTGLIDFTERYWDSMMPAIDKCFAASGASIFIQDTSPDHYSADYSIMNFNGFSTGSAFGFIWFDYGISSIHASAAPLVDLNWTWAYPFEPRYANISRLQQIEKSFNATKISWGGSPSYPTYEVSDIPPTRVNGFLFGPAGSTFSASPPYAPPLTSSVYPENLASPFVVNPTFGDHDNHWVADIFVGSKINGINSSAEYTLSGSANVDDMCRALYGFGDLNNLHIVGSWIEVAYDGSGLRLGTNHFASARVWKRENGVPYGYSSKFLIGPIIRGWKYGVYSGIAAYSKAYYRQGRYGQLRDMLEQRQYTKYYVTPDDNLGVSDQKEGVTASAVTVKFVNSSGQLTSPENTWSQNLSLEATSSVPYFDGETRNRPSINTNTLNTSIVSLNSNQFNQITI